QIHPPTLNAALPLSTVSGSPGVSVSPVSGALAELLLCAGEDGAGPLALSLVDGGGGSSVSVGVGVVGSGSVDGSVGVVGLVGSVGLLLVGGFVEDGGRVDDGGFVDVDVGSPGSPVPLGPSDGRADPLSV